MPPCGPRMSGSAHHRLTAGAHHRLAAWTTHHARPARSLSRSRLSRSALRRRLQRARLSRSLPAPTWRSSLPERPGLRALRRDPSTTDKRVFTVHRDRHEQRRRESTRSSRRIPQRGDERRRSIRRWVRRSMMMTKIDPERDGRHDHEREQVGKGETDRVDDIPDDRKLTSEPTTPAPSAAIFHIRPPTRLDDGDTEIEPLRARRRLAPSAGCSWRCRRSPMLRWWGCCPDCCPGPRFFGSSSLIAFAPDRRSAWLTCSART